MLRLCFIVSVFISFANSQIDHDWSLETMCEFHKSQYTKRLNGLSSDIGDVCQFKLPVSTANEKMAEKFCNVYIPYHITKVVSGIDITECQAEATLICKSGWIQFYGRCYRAEKKLMTKEKARDACKKLDEGVDGRIAFLHRTQLARHWKGYFTRVSKMWLDASEVFTDNLEYNKGPDLLLAFDGYEFGVQNDWLIRVPNNTEAFTICEYTPRLTKAESNYLLRRYSDIYYEHVSTSAGAFVRTASARIGVTEHELMDDNKYCRGVFRPFVNTKETQSGDPDKEFIEALLAKSKAEIIRTSVRSGDTMAVGRGDGKCTKNKQARNYGIFFPNESGKDIFRKSSDDIWGKDEPLEVCDGANWSTGISLAKSTNGLSTMSDARPAPILCQIRFETLYYGDCDDGWKLFVRENGQRWCHFFSGNKYATYDEADADCRSMKSVLDGFTSNKELELMNGMIGHEVNSAYLGARRKDECVKRGLTNMTGGFDSEDSSPCSRLRVFEWVNSVGPNPPLFLDKWMTSLEPNFDGKRREECLELMKGTITRLGWGTLNGTMKLNDITCFEKFTYFCGKEAPIKSKKIEIV